MLSPLGWVVCANCFVSRYTRAKAMRYPHWSVFPHQAGLVSRLLWLAATVEASPSWSTQDLCGVPLPSAGRLLRLSNVLVHARLVRRATAVGWTPIAPLQRPGPRKTCAACHCRRLDAYCASPTSSVKARYRCPTCVPAKRVEHSDTRWNPSGFLHHSMLGNHAPLLWKFLSPIITIIINNNIYFSIGPFQQLMALYNKKIR